MRARLFALLLSIALAAPAAGDDDHDAVRRARQRGEIVPLAGILADAESRYEGRMIEVELEEDDGIVVYELEMLTPQGKIIELTYDARSGAFLGDEGAGRAAARRTPPARRTP